MWGACRVWGVGWEGCPLKCASMDGIKLANNRTLNQTLNEQQNTCQVPAVVGCRYSMMTVPQKKVRLQGMLDCRFHCYLLLRYR